MFSPFRTDIIQQVLVGAQGRLSVFWITGRRKGSIEIRTSPGFPRSEGYCFLGVILLYSHVMKMTLTQKKVGHFVIFVFFLAVTLLIDFFHTEKTLRENPSCPACHFQNSSLATQTDHCLYQPHIDFVEVIEAFRVFSYERLIPVDLSPRGPPLA
jgi:hypothetical protein